MAAGAVITVVGSFLPWVRTGGRRRNSYDLFAIVGRLGFAPDGVAATALRWWPIVPLLAVVAVVSAWWGWPRIGGSVGVLAAAYAGGIGLAVSIATDASRFVRIQAGAPVTAFGGGVLLVGSVAAIVLGGRAAQDAGPSDVSPGPTSSTGRGR